jgi:tripartite-type tricarboxylate transporter receptor subunit TctC
MKLLNPGKLLGLAVGFSLAGLAPLQAQTPEEFYKGKTVTLVISAAPGGGADFFAREFAKYFAKHIPGKPNITMTNVAGAGGMQAAIALQNSRVRDGTQIALLQRNNFYLPIISEDHKAFDPRQVRWIGSVNKESYILVLWNSSVPLKKPDDVFTMPMKLGATGFANENRTIPLMMNEYFGTKITLVNGYEGNDAVGLAMERGEVQGRMLTVNSILAGQEATWYKEGKLGVYMQTGLQPHPAFPNIPNILSYTKDPEALAFARFLLAPLEAGRPFAVPMGVPEDRVAALRKAFDDAAKDPEFIAALEKLNSSAEPITGKEVEEIIASLYATPAPVLEKIKKLLIPPK